LTLIGYGGILQTTIKIKENITMTNITLQVEGMSCQHCVNSIEGALKEIGATGKVSLESNSVDVSFDENKITIDAVKEAIEEQGYDII
jgi:copper chaperone